MIQFEECKRFSPVLRRNLVVYTSIGRSHTLSAVIILEIYYLINNFWNSPYEISLSMINILCSKYNKYDLNLCVYMNNLMLTWLRSTAKQYCLLESLGLQGTKKVANWWQAHAPGARRFAQWHHSKNSPWKLVFINQIVNARSVIKKQNHSCFLTFNYMYFN